MPDENLKLRCTDLVLELTRRCNMKCEHCLRDDAQDLDMPGQLIENVMSRMDSASTLTFTGGEPTLVPDLIQKTLELAKKYGVRIAEAYIVTNGKSVPDAFLDACREWNAYCIKSSFSMDKYVGGTDAMRLLASIQQTDCERIGCYVAVSMDRFHEDIPAENLLRLASLPHLAMDKYNKEDDDKWVLGFGRAAWNGMSCQEEDQKARPWAYGEKAARIELLRDGDIVTHDGMIYIAADGTVLKYCDYSYDEQEDFALGRIEPGSEDQDWLKRLWEEHRSGG